MDVVVAKRNNDGNEEQHESLFSNCEVVIAVGLQSLESKSLLPEKYSRHGVSSIQPTPTTLPLFLGMCRKAPRRGGSVREAQPSLRGDASSVDRKTPTACRVHVQMLDLFSRWDLADDFGYAFMLFK